MKNSKLKIGVLFAFSAVLFLCLPGLMTGKAARKGKTPPNPDVTATISGSSGLLLGPDTGGPYTSAGADEVFAAGPGELSDWVLNLGDSDLTNRKVSVTFDPISGYTGPNLTGDYSGAIVSSRCFMGNLTVAQFWTIGDGAANPQNNCSLNVAVTYEGEGYLIATSPEYPGYGVATVTCTSASGSPCTSWTITTGSGPAVVIENYSNAKKAKVLGTATNNFNIAVTVE